MNKSIQDTKHVDNTSKKNKITTSTNHKDTRLMGLLENTNIKDTTKINEASLDNVSSENKPFVNQTENRLAIFIAENEFLEDEKFVSLPKPTDITTSSYADVDINASTTIDTIDINENSTVLQTKDLNHLNKKITNPSPHQATEPTNKTQDSSILSHTKNSKRESENDENIKKAEEIHVSYLDTKYDPCDPAYAENESVHPADRADQLEALSLEKQLCMLTRMDTEDAAEAIAELDGTAARDLIENLDAEDAAKILSAMDPDDAVDVLDEVEEGHRDVLLSNLAPEEEMELRALLSFDPDTAAGVMNTEIIIISQDESVDDAIHHIRLELEDKDMPYYVYAVDDHDILVGIISLRELMLSKPKTFIKELLSERRNLITAQFDLDKSEVARILSHYNFLALPVIDKEGHLMGAVTHDDVIDIIQDDASSDLLGMVGAGQDEDIYTPWTESVKLRLPWLFINMINSSLSAYIVYLFEGSITQMAFLAVLMPMVANQAGNTGQQALAVMIRQLATEKFDSKKSWKAVFRESKIGLTTGLIMAIFAIGIIWGLTDNPILGCIMGASLMLDMLLGSISGGSIPLILRALGRDPAQASSIFLTAITDGAGFFIFLSLATLFVL